MTGSAVEPTARRKALVSFVAFGAAVLGSIFFVVSVVRSPATSGDIEARLRAGGPDAARATATIVRYGVTRLADVQLPGLVPLLESVAVDPDVSARTGAISASTWIAPRLHRMGDEESLRRASAVVTRGLGDESKFPRREAAADIGDLCVSVPCGAEVVEALVSAARTDPDEIVRLRATRAVARIREHGGATPGDSSNPSPRTGDG